jgi:hypothetical protein
LLNLPGSERAILRRKVATLFRGLGPEKVAPSGPQKSESEEARSQN